MRRLREILPTYTNMRKEGEKRMKPGSFQWYPVIGQGAVGTN